MCFLNGMYLSLFFRPKIKTKYDYMLYVECIVVGYASYQTSNLNIEIWFFQYLFLFLSVTVYLVPLPIKKSIAETVNIFCKLNNVNPLLLKLRMQVFLFAESVKLLLPDYRLAS